MYERYEICSTETHLVELERSETKDGTIRWCVMVAQHAHAASLTLPLERAGRFAASMHHAHAALEGRIALGSDGLIDESSFLTIRAVPFIGPEAKGLVFVACGHPRGVVRLRMRFSHDELESLGDGVADACRLAADLSQGHERLVPDTIPAQWEAA